MKGRQLRPSTSWPRGLTVYTLAIVAVAFSCSLRGLPWWYQVIVAVIPVFAISFLWLTNQTDPGTIPPNQNKDVTVMLLEDGHTDIPNYPQYGRDVKGRWTRQVLTPEGHKDLEKYCEECHVWRPRRGYHCAKCGFCMDRGDHHCEVMGTCIARLNHRFFAAFLMAAQIGCGLMMGGSIWRLRKLGFPHGDGIWNNPETAILLFLAVFYGYHVAVLIFGNMHAVGICLDLTTKDIGTNDDGECEENLPCFPGRRNPKALLRTWHTVCCGLLIWTSHYEVMPLDGIEVAMVESNVDAHDGWLPMP
jgi:hypothetical protein